MAHRYLVSHYDQLKQGGHLSEDDCVSLQSGGSTPPQLSSLSVLLARRHRTEPEERLLSWILNNNKQLNSIVRNRYFSSGKSVECPEWLQSLFWESHCSGDIGDEIIRRLISEFTSGTLSPEIVSAWLMTVCMEGLSSSDTQSLTKAMRDSGSTYDYRNNPRLGDYKLVRRYPTGALSEKAALILPSLLAVAHAEYKVASPFLVARSLSFTGGTWDKLSAIPGFKFPLPGDESVDALLRCGVSMSVTNGDVAPADRLMYQLRSVTGTVESEGLIVASIASKQLALPADVLLMDIRYGDGAFTDGIDSARNLAIKLQHTITTGGVPTFCHFTDTKQPGGASIGNALEVAEAIAILGGSSSEYWDKRWLYEQQALVLEFFCKLMNFIDPIIPTRIWANLAATWLNDGTALSGFCKILQTHRVPIDTINKLIESPFPTLNIPTKPTAIRSRFDGYLYRFRQREIGYFVNSKLGGGGNTYSGEFKPGHGIVLTKRLGDIVRIGEPLCYIFTSTRLEDGDTALLADCFEIGE